MSVESEQAPSVALVDDNRDIRTLVCRGLRNSGINCHPFASGEDFLDGLSYLSFDCVLLDMRMPDLDGIETLKRIPPEKKHIPIIFFTSHADVPLAVNAMKSGARDLIEKPCSIEDIVEKVKGFAAHSVARSHRADMTDNARTLIKSLTPREKEVMSLVCQGLRSKQVGLRLSLSHRTIEAHRARATKKLGVNDLPNIVRIFQLAEAA